MLSLVNFVSDAIFYLFVSDRYFLYDSKGLEELTKNFVFYHFRGDVVNKNTEGLGGDGEDAGCSICFEPYEVGQRRKFLPCGHAFHETCIRTWLTESSQNCPLDGLPVATS